MKKHLFTLLATALTRLLLAQTTVLMPFNNGPVTITAPTPNTSYNFYDNGGAATNYSNNSNATSVLTFCPNNNSLKANVFFSSFATEATWDKLYIYDGPTTASTLFFGSGSSGSFLQGQTIQATAGNTSGCLTFFFDSDLSVNLAGWSATVTQGCTSFSTFYLDADGDGYGTTSGTASACAPPPGYVSNSTDCNDGNAAINPTAPEVCNGYDDDCDNLDDWMDPNYVDTELPTILCPPYVTLSNGLGLCAAEYPFQIGDATATDNCTIASITNDASYLPVGTTFVQWKATDGKGNTATCIQSVTVNDVTPPYLNCPPGMTISTNGGDCFAAAANITNPIADDNCSATVTNNAPDPVPNGQTVTFTATDPAGNTNSCSSVIMVQDLAGPLVTCPASITKPTIVGTCFATATYTGIVSDACSPPAGITFNPPSGSSFPVGMTIVLGTGTDAVGNTSSCQFTVTINPRLETCGNGTDDDCDGFVDEPITALATKTNVTCNGGANGSIDLAPGCGLAPYTFLWSNGATTEDLSGLTAAKYTVTITDAQGLTKVKTTSISQPPPNTASVAKTDPLCFGNANGTATATPGAGAAPFLFSWSTGTSAAQLFGLSAGTYTVTVTDANGCTASNQKTLNNPPQLQLSFSAVQPHCNGYSDGLLIAAATGGSGILNCAWTYGPPGPNCSLINIPAGAYAVTVTDTHGCSISGSWAVTQPPVLNLAVAFALLSNGKYQAFLTASGGTPRPTGSPYYYCKQSGSNCSWSFTSSYSNLLPGTAYTFMAKDKNNCEVVWTGFTPGGLNPGPTDDRGSEILGNEITLSPNPFAEQLILHATSRVEQDFSVEIFDLAGRLVLEKTWPAGAEMLDFQTEKWRSGVYVLRVKTADGRQTQVLRGVKMD